MGINAQCVNFICIIFYLCVINNIKFHVSLIFQEI